MGVRERLQRRLEIELGGRSSIIPTLDPFSPDLENIPRKNLEFIWKICQEKNWNLFGKYAKQKFGIFLEIMPKKIWNLFGKYTKKNLEFLFFHQECQQSFHNFYSHLFSKYAKIFIQKCQRFFKKSIPLTLLSIIYFPKDTNNGKNFQQLL